MTLIFTAYIIGNSTFAQDVNPDSLMQLKKRFSFANMYFGIEGFSTDKGVFPTLNSDNSIASNSFNGYSVPRLTWGATHFWGHSDIYISFPVVGYNKDIPAGLDLFDFSNGVETGFKVYPSKLKTNSIRPYVGWAWNIAFYKQKQTGNLQSISLQRNTTPILAGLSLRTKRFIIEGGLQYYYHNKFNYPVSPTINGTLEIPKFAYTFGAKYLLETTTQSGSSIKHKINALEKYNKFSAFYLGIGPSGSIGVQTFSEFDKDKYPFFKEHTRYFGIIPDVTAGYYFARPNMNIGISYRQMSDGYQGFGIKHYHERTSYMLESYKFLGDYHGFVPYVGLTLSNEKLFFANKVNNLDWQKYYETKPAVGVIFGWDIKPTKADSWLLRTNLRYTPLSMTVENKKVSYDYFEFNFIQLVVFPERIIALYKERKNK